MRWCAMLTHIGMARHYKPGWAAYKFKEKFGFWPPRPTPVPMEPSREVLSWVRQDESEIDDGNALFCVQCMCFKTGASAST
jgi:hypothetical protein